MKIAVQPLLGSVIALAVVASADVAVACPMCKAAAEADSKLPDAFLASILFMLAMPFTVATCFGVAFYRLSQRGAASAQALGEADLSENDDPSSDSQSV